jgi:hypothetical protein
MKLYEIAQEFNALKDIMENDVEFDEDTGEVIDTSTIIEELFSDISLQLNDKLDNAAYVVAELNGTAALLKEEAKRLSDRAARYTKNVEKLKELMSIAFDASGEKKIVTTKFTFSTRKSESLEIDGLISPDDFPRQYVRIKREFDKTKIKEALKNGETIDGVAIVTKQNFQIK